MLPKVRAREHEWFLSQLAGLNKEGLLPYSELLPINGPFCPGRVWAPWGKTMWRLYRAWCLARIKLEIPTEIWFRQTGSFPDIACPMCGELVPATLFHLLVACPSTQDMRRTVVHECGLGMLDGRAFFLWALADTADLDCLRRKVVFVGIASSSFVHARYGGNT